MQCSNIVHDADGNYKTSALEFETLTLLGSNCAIKTWEEVAELDRLCDEVGLDTVETGAAIAIYMESGALDWGDSDGAVKILKEIAEGTPLDVQHLAGCCFAAHLLKALKDHKMFLQLYAESKQHFHRASALPIMPQNHAHKAVFPWEIAKPIFLLNKNHPIFGPTFE